MEKYAVYVVTLKDDHTKDVEIAYEGTKEACEDFKKRYEETDRFPGKFLQVLPYRAAFKERVAHGVGFDDDIRGNIHHLVNPIMGMLRLDQRDVNDRNTDYYISRLEAVIALIDEHTGMYNDPEELAFKEWLRNR